MERYAEIRTQLEERLAILERRLGRIGADLRSAHDPDSGERAVERENDPVLEALDEQGTTDLAAIRAALGRLERGDYGRCAGCGEEIPLARLETVPTALHCIGCASQA